jgi:hypothetical protein
MTTIRSLLSFLKDWRIAQSLSGTMANLSSNLLAVPGTIVPDGILESTLDHPGGGPSPQNASLLWPWHN